MVRLKTGYIKKFVDSIDDVVRNTDVESISIKYYDNHIDVTFNNTDTYVLDYEFELDKITLLFLDRYKKSSNNLELIKKAIKHYTFDAYNYFDF